MPSGAHISAMSTPVNVAKRASPPAFLAAMFQTAWIRPARMTSARDKAGMERNQRGMNPDEASIVCERRACQRCAHGGRGQSVIERPLRARLLYGRSWPRSCKNRCLGFALSDDGLADRGGLMPTPSRRGARDQRLFSFMSG